MLRYFSYIISMLCDYQVVFTNDQVVFTNATKRNITKNTFLEKGGIISQLLLYREAKSRPSTSTPWDLISEKLYIEVNGERKIIFRSRLNCATN